MSRYFVPGFLAPWGQFRVRGGKELYLSFFFEGRTAWGARSGQLASQSLYDFGRRRRAASTKSSAAFSSAVSNGFSRKRSPSPSDGAKKSTTSARSRTAIQKRSTTKMITPSLPVEPPLRRVRVQQSGSRIIYSTSGFQDGGAGGGGGGGNSSRKSRTSLVDRSLVETRAMSVPLISVHESAAPPSSSIDDDAWIDFVASHGLVTRRCPDEATRAVLALRFPSADVSTWGLERPGRPPSPQLERYVSVFENCIERGMLCPLNRRHVDNAVGLVPGTLRRFRSTLEELERVFHSFIES